VSHRSIYKSWQ